MKTRRNLLQLLVVFILFSMKVNSVNAQMGKEDLPDLDPAAYKKFLNSKLNGTVKGYAFYLTKDGNYITSEAGGVARTPEDNNGKALPYSINTLQEIASVSKMITAVAMLRVLEKSEAVSLNSKIGPWLPKGWKPSSSFASISFRQLLSHKAGLREDSLIKGTYEEVMELHSKKKIDPELQKHRSYWNLNFQVLRVLISNIISPSYRQQDAIWATQLAAKTITMKEYNALIAENGSALYRNYVMDYLFKPAGIYTPTCNPVGHPNLAWAYETNSSTKGKEGKDHSLYCSSGFWQVSAKDMAVLMTKVMNSEDIISNSTKLIINNSETIDTVGWNYKAKRENGYYYGHGGKITWGKSQVNSFLMYMPDNYVAYVQVNSKEYSSTKLRGLLLQAYDAARTFPYNCYNNGGTFQFPGSSLAGHISKVGLGGLQQASGKSTGYTYYNNYVTSLKQDSSYSLLLNSGFSSVSSNVYWSVWIDYNQNGTFENTEKIFAKSSKSGIAEQAKIKIPLSATKGLTRMRVALKRHDSETIANACASFQYGEIEDYNIDITKPCALLANLKTVNISSTGATFRFDKPIDNVQYYVLRYQEVGSESWTITNPEISSPYTYLVQNVANLKPNTTYRWHVRNGCGDFSPYQTFKTQDVNICGTDLFEANPNKANAKLVKTGETISALICSNTQTADQDWYKLEVVSNTLAGTKIKIDLTSLPADYDLYLYDKDEKLVDKSIKGGMTNETIEKILSTGTYYIRVMGYGNSSHTHYYYHLGVKNSEAISSLRMADGETENIVSNEVVIYPNPSTGIFNIDFALPFSEGSLPEVRLFESMGNEVQALIDFDSTGKIKVDASEVKKGLYTIQVISGETIISKTILIQ